MQTILFINSKTRWDNVAFSDRAKGIEKKRGEREKEERELPCSLNVLKKYYSFILYSLIMLLKRDDEERGEGGAWSNRVRGLKIHSEQALYSKYYLWIVNKIIPS